MDYFFSRFTHPHLSVEKGLEFSGNVVNHKGDPFYFEIKISGESDPDEYAEITMQEKDGSFFTIYSPYISISRYLRKTNPNQHHQSNYSLLRQIKVIISHRLGMLELKCDTTMLSINFISPNSL